ncbi:nicotinate phosphoribosyltransferase [Salinispira pacifica]|uniref:Nicotinate phosphoribosyltransferase n=1 Tax=Salinispira pacifica TaxID=1307761 RepID=V5WIG6_9SPIO|nr:nicotinate phosphoribosyltransferase [Salinispira pacifica]AHC15359.1 Nicotinate phosphoribosyltransferase [Salinispira pacifica]
MADIENGPLLTDLYQLTMAYGLWKSGRSSMEGTFHLFFRKAPFGGQYCIAAGIDEAGDFLSSYHFSRTDLEYIASLKDGEGKRLFHRDFIQYLAEMKLECSIDAVAEGTPVFPFEPILRVQGPLLQCMLLETPLLNFINFPTLIATKASRIVRAAHGDPVLEFGLRRAQGRNGGLGASRAAYIGGCAATSNVLAGKHYGIPVKGTIAHSWVMSFSDELESFKTYVDVMPGNSLLLVDTYSTESGVHNAIEAGKRLREAGHDLAGIRLDSGDLTYLSWEARRMLDEAGFRNAKIVASNNLDEYLISSLKEEGAQIDIWGVGTRLITAYDQPALDGIYKLSAVRDMHGEPAITEWSPRLKVSEQSIKSSTPGVHQIRRYSKDGIFRGDAIYDLSLGVDHPGVIVDPMDSTRWKRFGDEYSYQDLLRPMFRDGAVQYRRKPLSEIRDYTAAQLKGFHPAVTRLVNPHSYPAGNETRLHNLRQDMIMDARESG